jgi:hypothetical protein
MSLVWHGLVIYAAWKSWGLRIALAISAMVALIEMTGIASRLLYRKEDEGKPRRLNSAQTTLMPFGMVWGTFVMFIYYGAFYCLVAWLLSKPIAL